MDETDYIEQIDEQLRAYEFSREEDLPGTDTTDIFTRTTDGVAPGVTHHEVVVVVQLQAYDVDAIEGAVETAQEVYDELDIEAASRFDSERWYLLIVAAEATKPMRIRAERAAGEDLSDESDAFLLPVLVDLDNSQLAYDDPSTLRRVTTHGKMASNVETYFRL